MEIYLSNSGQEPIYAQITRQIKEQILSGQLHAGDALPSIRLLAKELRISVITTKRAYEDLESAGFIITQPGRGSFVAAQNPALVREEHCDGSTRAPPGRTCVLVYPGGHWRPRPPSRCPCRWKTVWPPATPVLKTSR